MFLLWIKSEEGNDAELQTALYRGAGATATEYKIGNMKMELI